MIDDYHLQNLTTSSFINLSTGPGYSRSATGERFTKNWLTDYVKLDGVNRVAYRKQTQS